MAKLHFILFFLLVFSFSSCKKTVTENKDLTEKQTDSLVTQLSVYNDSIRNTWTEMDKNEATMIFNIKRLLEEISYMKSYDKTGLDSLKKQLEKVNALKYNQKSIAVTENVDKYDLTKDSLITGVNKYCEKLKNLDNYPLAKQLLSEIAAETEKSYLYRVRYNFHIQDYNTFIADNKPRLVEKKPALDTIQPKAKF